MDFCEDGLQEIDLVAHVPTLADGEQLVLSSSSVSVFRKTLDELPVDSTQARNFAPISIETAEGFDLAG